MTDIHQKKVTKNESTINPIAAGIAGAIAGGAAVAAAVIMSDKKNQKKVGNALVSAKEKVTDFVDSIKSQPVIVKSAKKLEDVVSDTKQKIEDRI